MFHIHADQCSLICVKSEAFYAVALFHYISIWTETNSQLGPSVMERGPYLPLEITISVMLFQCCLCFGNLHVISLQDVFFPPTDGPDQMTSSCGDDGK